MKNKANHREQARTWERNRQMAASRKGFLTFTIERAIQRARRRGRISPLASVRCHQNWVTQRNARSQCAKYQACAAAELDTVATFRREGNYASARYHLASAREFIKLAQG